MWHRRSKNILHRGLHSRQPVYHCLIQHFVLFWVLLGVFWSFWVLAVTSWYSGGTCQYLLPDIVEGPYSIADCYAQAIYSRAEKPWSLEACRLITPFVGQTLAGLITSGFYGMHPAPCLSFSRLVSSSLPCRQFQMEN